ADRAEQSVQGTPVPGQGDCSVRPMVPTVSPRLRARCRTWQNAALRWTPVASGDGCRPMPSDLLRLLRYDYWENTETLRSVSKGVVPPQAISVFTHLVAIYELARASRWWADCAGLAGLGS